MKFDSIRFKLFRYIHLFNLISFCFLSNFNSIFNYILLFSWWDFIQSVSVFLKIYLYSVFSIIPFRLVLHIIYYIVSKYLQSFTINLKKILPFHVSIEFRSLVPFYRTDTVIFCYEFRWNSKYLIFDAYMPYINFVSVISRWIN